jgi:hypothetical protein
LNVKLINDLDGMRALAFPPPHQLMESVLNAERRGERWRVIMAYERNSEQARWVTVLPDAEASQFYSDGDHLSGRWDADHELFIPEEGSSLNLLGKPVSLAALEEAAEDEDSEEAERRWQVARQHARENGSLSWGQGEY